MKLEINSVIVEARQKDNKIVLMLIKNGEEDHLTVELNPLYAASLSESLDTAIENLKLDSAVASLHALGEMK